MTPRRVAPMRRSDLDRVAAIAERSFADPWTRESFEVELDHPWAHAWILEERAEVLAFVVFWAVRDEIHILNLATDPAARRSGCARELLDSVIAHARSSGARYLSLEVHERNEAAVGLYQSLGFEPIGQRPNYYARNESAVVMFCALHEALQ
jgi:ribosomal-protein-alanine N-acetyltransferase